MGKLPGLDVRLPGVASDFQRELVTGIQIPIIFITGHGDIPYGEGHEIRSGGVPDKPSGTGLLDAIYEALIGTGDAPRAE